LSKKRNQVEVNKVVKRLKDEGRVRIKEGHGQCIELIVPNHWKPIQDQQDGVFLFFDLFQIRSVAEQFSEVSLDIVEYATKPTLYQTHVNRVLQNGPINGGIVRFAMIQHSFWNSLLFSFGQPLIYQINNTQDIDFETKEYFPLLSEGVKELYLSPEGDVKILKA
jgi:hypothetical protein